MTQQKPSPDTNAPAKIDGKSGEQKMLKEAARETAKEINGFADAGLKEPTRYGDWEVKGRCSDF